MKVLDFISQIGQAPPAAVYLICPHKAPKARQATFEPFLADRAAEMLVDAAVDPDSRDMAYVAFYADETPASTIALEAETLPFLAERRVVLVRNAERFSNESAAKPVLQYLANPCDTTLLIFIAARIDKRTKFYKACEKGGVIVECGQLNEREVSSWLHDEVRERGFRADGAAIQELVDRAGTRLSDVNNALSLVTTFLGEDENIITQNDVATACADVAEEEVWALTDAIAASDVGKSLVCLRRLIAMGKAPDELMGTINWLLTSAYAVAAAGNGPLPISRFVARKVQPLANRLGPHKMRDAFALCTDTHFMLRTTGVDTELALELLVVKLAAPRRAKAS